MGSYTQGDSNFREIWLQIKIELSAISSKEELAYLFNKRIKKSFPVSHALAIMFEGEDGSRRYILNQLSAFDRQMAMPRFEGRGKDMIIELARKNKSPTIVDLRALSTHEALPPYLSANVLAGTNHIVLGEIGRLQQAGIIVIFLDPARTYDRRVGYYLKILALELAEITGRLYGSRIASNLTKYRLLANACQRLANASSGVEFKAVMQDICLQGFGRKEFVIWAMSGDKHDFNVIAENVSLKGTRKHLYDCAMGKLEKELVKQIKNREKETLHLSLHPYVNELSGIFGDATEWMRTRGVLHLPLVSDTGVIGYLWIFYDKDDTDFGMAVSALVTLALRNLSQDNVFAIRKPSKELTGLASKRVEIPLTGSLSEGMKKISEQLIKVSPTELTVLLLGETGTGKNVLANAIHRHSARWQMPFITVNCAAISPEFMESELFGHEIGSFTSAVERRIGKFEQANGGTLFLDQIGEIPLALQVKLLRAIQEKEIERVGGGSSIPVDIRIIAATNRDIQTEVEHERFRRDLFFRLNGFSVRIPALRERREDIPALISYFLDTFGRLHSKPLPRLSKEVLSSLAAYDWPGNVRQLEYLMEKIVILSSESLVYEAIRAELKATKKPSDEVKTLAEVERDHILLILSKVSGKISGPGSAAELLKLPATTLRSKINKLGIKKRFHQ